jgi:hypothetical protein
MGTPSPYPSPRGRGDLEVSLNQLEECMPAGLFCREGSETSRVTSGPRCQPETQRTNGWET